MITHYHNDTPEAVKDVLTLFNKEFRATRLRLFFGDTATGEVWPEENDVLGYIGCSTGNHKVPLLVHNSRSMGGGHLLDHCIVGIKDVHGRWRYKHPAFNLGDWTLANHTGESFYSQKLPFEVLHNGKVHAGFETEAKAKNYIAFMKGERFSK